MAPIEKRGFASQNFLCENGDFNLSFLLACPLPCQDLGLQTHQAVPWTASPSASVFQTPSSSAVQEVCGPPRAGASSLP